MIFWILGTKSKSFFFGNISHIVIGDNLFD